MGRTGRTGPPPPGSWGLNELTQKSFEQVALEDAHHSMNGSFELLLLGPPQFSAVVIQKPQGSSCVCSNGADRRVTGINL